MEVSWLNIISKVPAGHAAAQQHCHVESVIVDACAACVPAVIPPGRCRGPGAAAVPRRWVAGCRSAKAGTTCELIRMHQLQDTLCDTCPRVFPCCRRAVPGYAQLRCGSPDPVPLPPRAPASSHPGARPCPEHLPHHCVRDRGPDMRDTN
jgi:hypothetical protein